MSITALTIQLKKITFIILLLLLLCASILFLLASANAQESEEANDVPVTVRIAIFVHDIDEKKRLAYVSINAFIDNYPYDENYLFDENEIELQLWGGGYAQIKCK